MGPRPNLGWTLIAVALACRRNVDRPPRGDATAPPARAPQLLANSASGDQAIPEGYCHPAVVLSIGRGGAIVDACFDPQSNRTDLLGQRVDADAMAVGARVRLRQIPGSVVSLAATVVEGSVRLAWVAHVGDGAERSDEFNDRAGGTREVAVQTLSPALALVGVPVVVNRYAVAARGGSSSRGWARSRVELAPGPEHSLLALTTDAEEACPQGGLRCASWSIFSIQVGGAVRRVRHESSASPSYEPQSLIRIGDDVAYLRGDDAVRSILYVHSLRAGGAAVSIFPSAMFDPLPDWTGGSLAWTGGAIVALGEERAPDAAEARPVVRVTSLTGPSPTRPRATDEPEAVRWPVVTGRTWRCVRRHPVLRITWRGGAIELDPTVPNVSFDLSRWLPPSVAGIPERQGEPRWLPPMAWTGRALLAIDGHDQLRRWTCERDGDPPTE